MKSKLYLFLALICLCCSCSNEEDNLAEVVYESPYLVSLDDALKQAEAFYESIGQGVTRTGKERKIQNVQSVNLLGTSTRTRSSKEHVNSSLYLVNYEDNSGFALLASDSRLPPVFGISEIGSLYMQDTIDNKGLAIVLKKIAKSIEDFDVNKIDETRTTTSGSLYITPMLASGASAWHQGYPFNEQCPIISGERAFAGCTAVATAQIMSYYNWPEEIGHLALDWPEIKIEKEGDYSIQYLLMTLGTSQYLNMKYTGNISYIASDSLNTCFRRTFQKLNYSDPGNFCNFSISQINSALENGPVIVKGETPTITIPNAAKNYGHVWIVDGAIFSFITYLHCVWGLGKYKDNGYFYYGDFVLDPDAIYTENMKYLANFHPIKNGEDL